MMRYLFLIFVFVPLSFVIGLFVGDGLNKRYVSSGKDSMTTSTGIPVSYEKKETGFPNMQNLFRVGNFAIITSDDYASFTFHKWPPEKQVPVTLLMEGVVLGGNPDEIISSYHGFGGDPSGLMTISADKKEGKINGIFCCFPEKLSYPYEYSPSRYHYFDFDGDGLWDDFIDGQERKGYKRDGLNWVLIE